MVKTRTRLQRKREKESSKQALKYFLLIILFLFLLVRFGLPGLIRLAAFIGDLRSSSQPIEKQDQLAPRPPILNPVPEATTSADINLSGYAETGATIKLSVRGITVSDNVADNEGGFEFLAVHLREGENEIFVVAIDDQGNVSEESTSYKITVDKTAPKLSLESPADGDRFFDNDNPISIKGSSEEGIGLRINGRFLRPNSDGSFEMSLGLSEGDNEIEVKAVDHAGNETVKKVTVNYTP
jgi:bacillopeptidase F